eukprot:CAMPEP_0184654200 /NCGR_PEP_ID=MMETSP0308-20130426/11915_1 /TAXON_ID=38269 /ORGANISM="Gloeochaete witrockiana, Strain SAG 46.84" /LENGTH=639 /DNA_ID=CAMNT_0027090099 /DNA_START=138 /DNA_END=2057 /DNA_ORIENTATION=+
MRGKITCSVFLLVVGFWCAVAQIQQPPIAGFVPSEGGQFLNVTVWSEVPATNLTCEVVACQVTQTPSAIAPTPSATPEELPSPTPEIAPSQTTIARRHRRHLLQEPTFTEGAFPPAPTEAVLPTPTEQAFPPAPTEAVLPTPTEQAFLPAPTEAVLPTPTVEAFMPTPTEEVGMPTQSAAPTPSDALDAAPSSSPTVVDTPTSMYTPSDGVTPTNLAETATYFPTSSFESTPSPSLVDSPTPTLGLTPSFVDSPSPTGGFTPTSGESPTPSFFPTSSFFPTPTLFDSPTPSFTPTILDSPTPSPEYSATPTATDSPTPFFSATPTPVYAQVYVMCQIPAAVNSVGSCPADSTALPLPAKVVVKGPAGDIKYVGDITYYDNSGPSAVSPVSLTTTDTQDIILAGFVGKEALFAYSGAVMCQMTLTSASGVAAALPPFPGSFVDQASVRCPYASTTFVAGTYSLKVSFNGIDFTIESAASVVTLNTPGQFVSGEFSFATGGNVVEPASIVSEMASVLIVAPNQVLLRSVVVQGGTVGVRFSIFPRPTDDVKALEAAADQSFTVQSYFLGYSINSFSRAFVVGSTPQPVNTPSSSGSSSLSGGAIFGIVVGVLVGAGLLVFVVLMVVRRRKASSGDAYSHDL